VLGWGRGLGTTSLEPFFPPRTEESYVPLLEVDDHQIHVIDRGSGDAVVFLHAFPLQAAMWDYQVDAFEETHRCLAIDLPGFGASTPEEDTGRASMQHWSKLVVGVLDQLGIDKATIVGCSMGGYLAMAVLRHHPDRVERLVLCDTKAKSDDAGGAARRTEQQNQVRSGSEISSMAKGMVESFLSAGSMARPELVSYVHALADGGTPEGWIGALEAMKGRPDSMLLLRQAKVPALVVVGELDRVSPIAEARSIRLLIKGELVVVPNVGHLPNLEDPLAFNESLAAFLGAGPAAGDAEAAAVTEATAATEAVDAAEVTEATEAAGEPEAAEATGAEAQATEAGDTSETGGESAEQG
jgi:pimeloyl-ACP methyl ester carboxylesterase